MKTASFWCLVAVLLCPAALGSPILEPRQGAVTTLSSAQVSFFKPYTHFAAAAYCPPSQTLAWHCGANCNANAGFVPIASGGDGVVTQFWYVGFDKSIENVIVAYQGTDPSKIIPAITDADFFLEPFDTAQFPGLSSSIRVHNGFKDAHARSASAVLSAAKTAMSKSGFKSVTVVGHSLGGALALISSVHLRLCLPAGTTLNTVTYGMPRVGNQAFVDYVNSHGGNSRVNNRHDLVPILPGRFLGFHHTNTELHILDSLQWVQCAGEDNTKAKCEIGYVPNVFSANTNDHMGPYGGISMGCQ